MCRYQTLAQSRDGYIIRCPQCKNLQFAFGTCIKTIEIELFRELIAVTDLELQCNAAISNTRKKQFALELNDATYLCLSYKELERLNKMLHQAAPLLSTYLILEESLQ